MTNQLTTSTRQRLAPTPVDPVRKIGDVMRRIRTELLDDADRRLNRDHPDWYKIVFGDLQWRKFGGLDRIWREADRRALLDELMALAAKMPTSEELTAIASRRRTLAAQVYDRAQARTIVGLFVDGYPNARPHEPAVYVETLFQQIEAARFSPAAIAQGLDEILRTSTFLPSIAEALKACEAARDSLEAPGRYEEGAEIVGRVATAIATLEAQGPIPPDEERAHLEAEEAERRREETERRRRQAEIDEACRLEMLKRKRRRELGLPEVDVEIEIPF